jgi:16S rRNA (guanine527-N7)-methyltransferase
MSDVAPPPEPFDAAAFAAATGADARQMGDMARYQELLSDWNDQMNLVGPNGLTTFWLRHAYDSAQLLHVEQSVKRWADVGAGAGFPGVVLAILLKGRPGSAVHLIESMGKRVRFLDAVTQALDLPVVLHHARAEDMRPLEGLEVVTARACAPLPRLLGYTQAFFKAGARGVFLKGRDVEAELTEARRSWRFEAELLPSRSDPSGRILRIERLSRG